MGRKEGFCDSCQQNKDHRRVAGVFSLINLLLLGIPSLVGISTWECTHCRSLRFFLFRHREQRKQIPSGSFTRSPMATPPPNGGLEAQKPREVKSTRSQLYSEKYRDAVAKRIVSGVTSIKEVNESLELPDLEVIDWVKQSFRRNEDRLEMFRDVLIEYQKDHPDFEVEEVVRCIQLAQKSSQMSSKDQTQTEDDSGLGNGNRIDSFPQSIIPYRS